MNAELFGPRPVQRGMQPRNLWIAAAASMLLLPACGGAASFSAWDTGGAGAASRTRAAPAGRSEEYATTVASSYEDSDEEATADGQPEYEFAGDSIAGQIDAQERYAQASPEPEQASPSLDPPAREQVADDAHHGPLLIYTADLRLAVHQVSEKQGIIEALATAAGGHLDQRTQNRIRIRVPAARFDEVLAQILELGDVLSRDVSVQDVSEQFHDMALRIRTLEAMYARVQQLLAQAENVEQALAVEQHLQRITVELEQLRGRLRFLADRIAFSTITIQFQEQATVTEPTFSLPFQWLQSLGLQDLMRLR